LIDFEEDKLVFSKKSGGMIVSDYEERLTSNGQLTKTDAVGLPLPHAKAMSERSKSTSENTDI